MPDPETADGEPVTDVVAEVCARLELHEASSVRRSEATTFTARTVDGDTVSVRVGACSRHAVRVTAELAGPWFRAPRLRSSSELQLGGAPVQVQCWEHVGGRHGSAGAAGRAAALIAAGRPSASMPPFDPFARAHPSALHLDAGVVSAADVEELYADAARRWAWWCARHERSGWTHGDWNESNMLVCDDGSFFVFDLGDAGAGPVGFDAACLAVQGRFTRTPPGSVHDALSAYAQHSAVAVVEIVACLEPVAAYVIAARVAASDDPVRVAVGSARLADLVAERRGARVRCWLSLADAIAAASGEAAPEVP